MNSVILENSSVIVHGSMIGSYRWQKTGKIVILFGETHFEVEVKSPVTIECHDVECSHSHAAGYLKTGWRTNILAMHSVDKS